MKILSWKVRGMGRKGFRLQFKDIINCYSPELILLMETEVQPENTKDILKSFFLTFIISLNPYWGLLGGIWLLWRSNSIFSFQLICSNYRFVYGKVYDYNENAFLVIYVCVWISSTIFTKKNYGNKYLTYSIFRINPGLLWAILMNYQILLKSYLRVRVIR